MTNLLPWLNNKAIRIAVVGDVILDEYLSGSVSRISPEAPVPILHVKKVQHEAGGAANTARNIVLAGGQSDLYSVCGNDHSLEILLTLLRNDGVSASGLIVSDMRPTIKKTRISAQNQQMMRMDWENIDPINQNEEEIIPSKLHQNRYDFLVISDYGKGALPPSLLRSLFAYAAKHSIRTIVDPKAKDFSRYRGANFITPNRREAMLALGLDPDSDRREPYLLARELIEAYQLENVLLTLGEDGMLFLSNKDIETPYSISSEAREVFDVSGAGDTVVAIFALAIASGCNVQEAMNYANTAASIVVGKWGTQPVTKEELSHAISLQATYQPVKKLIPRTYAAQYLTHLKKSGKKIVFTNGCFDVLHAGHLQYLTEARKLGDCLIVAVNDGASVRRLKGSTRPVNPLLQRQTLLAGLSCVDLVTEFHEDTPEALIREISPDILVKGADYKIEDIAGSAWVLSTGGQVKTLPLLEGFSTTKILSSQN